MELVVNLSSSPVPSTAKATLLACLHNALQVSDFQDAARSLYSTDSSQLCVVPLHFGQHCRVSRSTSRRGSPLSEGIDHQCHDLIDIHFKRPDLKRLDAKGAQTAPGAGAKPPPKKTMRIWAWFAIQ